MRNAEKTVRLELTHSIHPTGPEPASSPHRFATQNLRPSPQPTANKQLDPIQIFPPLFALCDTTAPGAGGDRFQPVLASEARLSQLSAGPAARPPKLSVEGPINSIYNQNGWRIRHLL